MFEYESFPRSRSRPASTIAPWSKAVVGQRVDRVPARVARERAGSSAERDEPEIRGRELPALGVAGRIAPRPELLEVRDLAHVDLGREVPEDRALERLVRDERPAGERPRARVRLARALPQEHGQLAVAHLEHGGERDVRG